MAPLARQTFAWRLDTRIVSSFDGVEGEGEEAEALHRAAGHAWLAGASVNFTAVHGGTPRRRVALSPYPLRRERYWLERPEQEESLIRSADPDVADMATLIARQQEVLRLQLSLLAGYA